MTAARAFHYAIKTQHEDQEASRRTSEQRDIEARLEAEAERMSAREIVALVRSQGAELALEGTDIVARPSHQIDRKARIAIAMKRAELIIHLTEASIGEPV